jgi:hypothetical protein
MSLYLIHFYAPFISNLLLCSYWLVQVSRSVIYNTLQIRQLTELKSGIREDIHLIRCIDEDKVI